MSEALAIDPAELGYTDLVSVCMAELRSPSPKSGIMAVWARLLLEAMKAHKEEQRLLEGAGANAVYSLTILAPCSPPNLAPLDGLE